MPKPSEAQLEVSKRLLAHQFAGGVEADTAAAAELVYEALVQTLNPLIGAAGTHALFVRSLKLAKAEYPGLGKVAVVAEPSGIDPKLARALVGCLRGLEPNACTEAAVGLFAVLLDLLTHFIGERLVLQILHKAFPGIDLTPPKESE